MKQKTRMKNAAAKKVATPKNKRKGGSKPKSRRCPECDALIKAENYPSHMQRVHHIKVSTKPESVKRSLRRLNIMTAVGIVAALIVAGAYVAIDPNGILRPSAQSSAGGGTTTPPPSYTPTHRPGSGANDFWTVFPAAHAQAGSAVPFPSWIAGYFGSKVLLILDHSEGCSPCVMMQNDVNAIMAKSTFASSVTYLDLLSGGPDPRAEECFGVFDPDGVDHYIPLTIVVTKDSSGQYLWHSWEGVMGQANLEQWLSDAHYYLQGGA